MEKKIVTPKWPAAQYKLTLDAYMPDAPGQFPRICKAESIVLYDGVPGAHMTPLDQQAFENMAAYENNRQPRNYGTNGTLPPQAAQVMSAPAEDMSDLLGEGDTPPPPVPVAMPPKPPAKRGRPAGRRKQR